MEQREITWSSTPL